MRREFAGRLSILAALAALLAGASFAQRSRPATPLRNQPAPRPGRRCW